MLVDLDRQTRSVRLDDEGLATLLASRPDPRGAAHRDLAIALSSGVLDAALAAVAEPVVRLDLVVAGRDVRLEHRGRLGRESLALVLGVRPGLHQLMTVDPAFLTASLVRLTRMRPRRPAERAETNLDAERLTDLVSGEPEIRRAALEVAGADFAWDLAVTWAGGGRRLVAVDGPRGIHLGDPPTGALHPASNTFVYRVLSTVLPTDAELTEASAVASPLHG